MDKKLSYQEYAGNKEHMKVYSEYQEKYRTTIRESDKILISYVRDYVQNKKSNEPISILDIGCSTGNLLLHLKNLMPELELWGGDLAEEVVTTCQENPELKGITFKVMDATNLGHENKFDLVIANAIFFAFSDEVFLPSLKSIEKSLKPEGTLLVFDYFHPFEQDLEIIEKSNAFPKGLTLHARSYKKAESCLKESNFEIFDFQSFVLPFSLEKPEYSSITTYTQKLEDGSNLCFRGVLNQPWCHLIAGKK